MDKDIEYIVNNKIYNISKSNKIYEYRYKEGSGIIMFNGYEMPREVIERIYKSSKGNLYKTTSKSGRIGITDIIEDDLKELLLKRNELDLLRELYPCTVDELEEV